MNKSALKNFAIKAREDLIQQVERRANIFGIDKNTELKVEEKHGQLVVNGKTYPIIKREAFHSLNRQLKVKGYDQLIEEAAYTWFNRIIAIRYMEVNEYLPERVNVLSSSTGKAEPDILLYYETMDLKVNKSEIDEDIKQKRNEDAYKKLFVAQCNALHEVLPFLFEKINDYTELLLPDFLLDSESVISNLVKNEDLTESFKEVEVIGWLYQYYNTVPKARVDAYKGKKKVPKEDVPAKTQLFTPNWIVRYMVENSIGRLWLEGRPNDALKSEWKYYLEEAVQDISVMRQLDKIKEGYKNLKLEEIKILDPCMGSGHILIYAFEVLMQIYVVSGYTQRDAATLIIKNNLYGIDIDDRAYQLAYFAVMMKGREYDRRFLTREVTPNLCAIQESNGLNCFEEGAGQIKLDSNHVETANHLINKFKDAKEYGSILDVENRDYDGLLNYIYELEIKGAGDLFISIWLSNIKEIIPSLIKQGKMISQKYDVVITNPPYFSSSDMSHKLSDYVKKKFPNSKSDMFAVFIEKGFSLCKANGFNCMVTMQSWMFLSSYEKLREKLLKSKTIFNLMHMGNGVMGIAFGTAVSNFRNCYMPGLKGVYNRIDMSDIDNDMPVEFPSKNNRFNHVSSENLQRISGMPIAYWMSEKIFNLFKNISLIGEFAETKQGFKTGNNDLFLRLWFEVPLNNMQLDVPLDESMKWFPCNKGGDFRKWYGNYEYVVNWEKDGNDIRNYRDESGKLRSRPQNLSYNFKEGLTWSSISSGNMSMRYSSNNLMYESKGPGCFVKNDKTDLKLLLAYFNSHVCRTFISTIAPTIDYTEGSLLKLPYINLNDGRVIKLTDACINISKVDWDNFEISWDFNRHPLMKHKNDLINLSIIFENWREYTENQFNQLKSSEEELNRIFIDIYGLQDELTPEVEEKDITIRKADRLRDTKSFLSYFIGCVMGRYSLDVDGLAYAGGEWDESKYSTFKPNKYGIILLTDERYFENDIITRLREFLKAAFGPETVEENLKWIAESLELKRGETAEERLRRYFIDEFFNDHTKIYQKRPIYWLVDSGKQKGLRTLVYMHRYEPATMATIRFEHLQEIQGKYHNEIAAIETRLSNANLSASEKRELDKKKDSYKKKLNELVEFDKHLATYANQQINIDLDDGVKVNYAKFDKVLAKLK